MFVGLALFVSLCCQYAFACDERCSGLLSRKPPLCWRPADLRRAIFSRFPLFDRMITDCAAAGLKLQYGCVVEPCSFQTRKHAFREGRKVRCLETTALLDHRPYVWQDYAFFRPVDDRFGHDLANVHILELKLSCGPISKAAGVRLAARLSRGWNNFVPQQPRTTQTSHCLHLSVTQSVSVSSTI